MSSRTPLMIAIVSCVLFASVLWASTQGEAAVSLADTWAAWSGDNSLPWWKRLVVIDIRTPRVILAALVGGALAASGAASQALFRNPMADPSIIGVSSGAALGAVTALYLAPANLAMLFVPMGAFATALGCTFLVYAVSTSMNRTPLSTLLLSGIAVSSIASALTSFVLALALSEWEVGKEMVTWLLGSLEGRQWTHVFVQAPFAVLGTAGLLAFARDLNLLAGGEESAATLGVDVQSLKRYLLVLVATMTAASVAVTGVIAFVGLAVPHLTRLVAGPDHRRLIPLSFLVGGILVVWADLICRIPFASGLRVGVVTSLLGGPFFLFLLLKHRVRAGTL